MGVENEPYLPKGKMKQIKEMKQTKEMEVVGFLLETMQKARAKTSDPQSLHNSWTCLLETAGAISGRVKGKKKNSFLSCQLQLKQSNNHFCFPLYFQSGKSSYNVNLTPSVFFHVLNFL